MGTARIGRVASLCVLICSAASGGPIHDAARVGDAETAAALLAADPALIASTDEEGLTPLHLAALGRNAELVKALLAQGAPVDARDATARTPLHYAAMGGDADTIALLLEAGATVDARDVRGETPLHVAGRRMRAAAAGLLLDAGADVNARNAEGQTPLLLAVDQGEEAQELDEAIRALAAVLIARGADVNLSDTAGHTPLGRARLRAHELTIELLVDAGAAVGNDPGAPHVLRAYRTHAEIEQILADAQTNYPGLARKVVLGTSVQGRNISALKITDNPDAQEDEPEFRYVSTMHGDEVVGIEMCLFLIDDILTKYGSDSRITDLVNETEIWIVPLMNPDGNALGQRYNANGADLNRSFPDPFTDPNNTTAGREPEVAAIMNWSWAHSFTLGANFHGGALVVNYPYDNNETQTSGVYTACPDDALFISISELYSQTNTPMWNSPSFFHGITNGTDWYVATGGMQDWGYRYVGSNETTIELSNVKTPSYSTIPQYWAENQESMLSYMETVHIGVRGLVTDSTSGAPLDATVSVVGNDQDIVTDPDVGDYHRMLLPGTYDLLFTAPGYDPKLVTGVVVNAGSATRLDIALDPAPVVLSPNGGETLGVGTPAAVTWSGGTTAQYQVQETANDGDLTLIQDGFESASISPPWGTGGNGIWAPTFSGPHAGFVCVKSGTISDNQQSWLTRPVDGPADLSFWYKVSSEADYDFLRFDIDGTQELAASGSVGWTQFSTTVPAGSHTLRWRYTKDVNTSSGSDAGWIDDVEIIADGRVWNDIEALTPVGASSSSWTPTVATTAARVRVRSVLAGGLYGDWDESDAAFTVDASSCTADVTTTGAGIGDPGYGVPDGSVTATDLNYFVNAWVAGDLAIADITTTGAGVGDPGYGVPDGSITAADLNYFVNAWVAGCP